MDVQKQINYWRDGSEKALRSIPTLIEGKFWAEALFWMHLAVEKALKAHVSKKTQDIPPYIHNLVRLADISGLALSAKQVELCAELNKYQRLARYPDEAVLEPDDVVAQSLLDKGMELQKWLVKIL